MNLDGETNLKPWIIANELANNETFIPYLKGKIMCDWPNASLEDWDATIQFKYPDLNKTYPLKINNLLLRGCFLRNIEYCYGVVVYLGLKTKIMMNAKKAPRKVSMIMKMMNWMLYTVFFFQFLIICLYATLSTIWKKNKGENYEYLDMSKSGNSFGTWIV